MNSSKNFKSIKNLSMNTKKIENNNNGNHNRYDNESDEKINNNSDNNEEEKQTDITLQYAKKLN
ncbi:hypothetical protein JTT01_01080 [Clostridium botulinum]|nr:hypothetical protein [Clostridium botulinum]MCS4463446.1 hypothetical protein [Clostridium botulinum]